MAANEEYVVVVGGMNLDIAGMSGPVYREHDSNIGKVGMNVGGVGQNIAHNLAKLGVPTYLVTVYGDDYWGRIVEEECEKNKVLLTYAQKLAGQKSSIYLYINDNNGDLVTAINDMEILTNMTPAFLEPRLSFINQAKIVVLDCNLPKETIEWIGQNVTAPIFVDPVSVAKTDRIAGILDKIDTLKPNGYESALLTGIEVTDEESAKKAAKKLNEMGVKNVFISLGEQGILCARDTESTVAHPLAKKIVSTNGAGDTTMATIVWSRFAYGSDIPLEKIGRLTQAAASINLESPLAVAEELSPENILARLEEPSK